MGCGELCFFLDVIPPLHPVVITALCVCLAWKCVSLAAPIIPVKIDDDPEIVSATEPPSGDDSGVCMAYQVQLHMDKYRLLSNERCNAVSDVNINISGFGCVAQLIGGVEVSGSPHSIYAPSTSRSVYKTRDLPNNDCLGRVFGSVASDWETAAGRIEHMRARLKFEGMAQYKGNCTISTGSPMRSDTPRLTHFPSLGPKRNERSSSCVSSSDVVYSGDTLAIPSLTKHMKVNRPNGMFPKRRLSLEFPKKEAYVGNDRANRF